MMRRFNSMGSAGCRASDTSAAFSAPLDSSIRSVK